MNIKTDLILEVAKLVDSKNPPYESKIIKGNYGLTKTHIKILNEEGSSMLNKDIGDYTTIDCEKLYLFNDEIKEYVAKELAINLIDLMKISGVINPNKVLVVGLGNKEIIADSLGPKVTEKIIITRHIKEVVNKKIDERLKTVSALSTGVLGTTGIETASIVKAVVKEVKPDVVIVVDTLSTLETKRIASCFQTTNTGIIPGGGVGNNRDAINKKSLGVPVIVVGMPLVVYAYSMCKEVLQKASDEIKDIEKYERELENIASSLLGELVVTIKDIDDVVENCSNIIALAINIAINKEISVKEALDYMN